nr:unnamed protein product [Spirometra erinaceieuropaei]
MHSGLLIFFGLSAVFEVSTHVSNTIRLLIDSSKEKMTLPSANTPQQAADLFPVAWDNPQGPMNTIYSESQNEMENRQNQAIPKTGTMAEQELQTRSQNTLDVEGPTSDDTKQRSRRAATSRKSHLWPSGIIPYEIEPLFSSSSMSIILAAMRIWENVTCVTFVEREPHHQSCCSNVGRQNENRPQTISIAPSCESVRTVVHELGHAMGFWHEQSRPDRDAYVEILTENIRNDRLYNFDKKDQYEIDSLGEPYDYDSIMHYARNLFAKPGATETLRPRQCCPRPKIGHLPKPSAGDARQMNKLYSCPSCGQTFLDNSATFAAPNVQTSLSSAEASNGRHKSDVSTQTPPFQGHAQSSPLQSETSDPLFCRWRIIAASGERIQLTFTHMDMLPPTNLSQNAKQKPTHSSSCLSEYVEVRDGYYSGSPVIGRYCGNSLPKRLVSSTSRMLIEYAKSAGQPSTGFIATYQVVCGDIMQADDGIFSSPGYPNHYPPNRECTWRIEVPVGFAVLLTFYSFDLERGQNCPYDYLEIFDGPSVYSPKLVGLCGVGLPNPIRSTNSTMTVRLVTDAKVQKQGFAARFQKISYAEIGHCARTNHDCEQICVNTAGGYKCQCYDGYNLLPDKKSCEPNACGGYLRADKGNITSPTNIISKPPNKKCIWRIEVSAGFSVQLSFDSFELEEQSDCSSNYVQILDGSSDSSPVLCKVCGSSLRAPITSTKNSMTVKFVSDGGLDNNRFTARFKKMISCVNYIKADNGDISSPDYPNNYPPNSNCIWRIEVPVGFSVLLNFESFDIEEEKDCSFDYLEIYDGSSECSPKLRRLSMHFGLLLLFVLGAAFAVRTRVVNTTQRLSDLHKEEMIFSAINIPQQTARPSPIVEDTPQDPVNTVNSEAENEAETRPHQTTSKKKTAAEHDLRPTSQNTLDAEGSALEGAKQRSRRAATSRKSHLWPSGIIPYEIEPLFFNLSRTMILTAMRMCCSNVGRQDENRPQTISIAPSCQSVRTVLHELGHAMGFWHEQSRHDRDAYVEILTENIKNDSLHNFEKKDQHEVDSLGEPYDYDSIMHYAKNLFAKPGATETIRFLECCPHPKIGHLRKPSESDVRQMNKLYSCPGRYCGNTLPNSLLSSGSRMVIEYVKSAGQSGTGFEATYQVVCGDIMQADEGIFTSPGYPDTYPSKRECIWRIEVPAGFANLLTFYSFELEGGQNCQYDYLDIFDGSSTFYPSLGQLCGTELPKPIRSTGNEMTVRFVTDAGVQKQGFAARFQKVSYAETGNCVRANHDCEQVCVNTVGGYKCQCYDGYNLLPDKKSCQPAACGGYMRANKGDITSPVDISNYPPNSKCVWEIEVSAGFSVLLTFENFELEEQSDCSSNYVEILDGLSKASPVLCKVCGSNLPASITSTKNSMTVKFVSDGGLDNNRFTARFRHVISCGDYIKADNGNISSPDYPNNYPPNSKCIWRIEVPVGFSVLLTFESFDLEEETDCSFDYLEIFDGSSESSPMLRKLCGSRIPTAVASTKNTLTVKFNSDNLGHQKGFKANFKKVIYSEVSQCAITDHGCEHLCVDIPGGYKCQCNDDFELLPDKKSCQSLACGGYLRKGEGYITSPGFPKEYPPNSRCIWRIEVPSGFFVVLTFNRFELEDQLDCQYDYLEIYDGPLDPSSMLRKMCGTPIPEPVNSTSNVMTLKFVTDSAFHKKGFKVRYQLGTPPKKRLRSAGRP